MIEKKRQFQKKHISSGNPVVLYCLDSNAFIGSTYEGVQKSRISVNCYVESPFGKTLTPKTHLSPHTNLYGFLVECIFLKYVFSIELTKFFIKDRIHQQS